MSRRARALDVAIVGMACRFPGAGDLSAYWENTLAARDSIGDVPPGRWAPAVFHDPDSADPGRVDGRRGGYLDDPIRFDPSAFGIMPRTVEGGEPEQFLVLDAARSALADAGLAAGVPGGSRVEVVIGRGNSFNRGDLARLQHGRVIEQTLAILRALHPEMTATDLDAIRADLRASLPPFEEATVPGRLTNATSGRVADRFDLAGASYVVDAASASGLVAVDLGARALASRRADLAIVGSVYIEADVDFPMVFSRFGVLSRRGRARPFAADADGMVPGEGVGAVVLKRLADAERDGDRVYAIVKGLGLAGDGRGPGLAAPDAKGHLRAIRRAYRSAGVDPATVGLIEGHGLGVPAADRAELRALRAAFPAPAGGARRVLGAASGLIGHAMPAAGMAGLIKAALALHHRMLPASVGADRPHRWLARVDSPMTLNPSTRPWIGGDDTPRRAGVNAFGFAGISVHAVLEEHPASADGVTPGAMTRWPTEAILLSAPDRQALADRARSLAVALRRRPDVALKDVAYTIVAGPGGSPGVARLGLVVASVEELITRLESIAPRLADPACPSIRDGRGMYYWASPLGASGRLACLFPGEGSQYAGMLADLCPHFPEVRALFDTSDRIARESGAARRPSETLFGHRDEGEALWAAGLAVNVVLSAQWALYRLLLNLGLRPAAVAGHSSGEFLALAAAGSIRVDRGLEARLADLAGLLARVDASGGVAARLVGVASSRDRVEAAIGDDRGRVAIAVDNCPHQVVIAGPGDAVEAVVGRLRGAGLMTEDLPFGRAYHTPEFAPMVGPIREFFDGLDVFPPSIPLYSCCSAARVADDPAEVRRLAVAQWTRPVEFRRTVEAMHADGFRLFVDVGARGNLAGFVEDTLRGRPAFAVAANQPRRSGLTQINHLVASLFAQGIDLKGEYLFARRRPRWIDLESPPEATPDAPVLRVRFPEMTLSAAIVDRFRVKPRPAPDETPMVDPTPIELRPPDVAATDEAMLAHLATMDAFLRAQKAVMDGLVATPPIDPGETETDFDLEMFHDDGGAHERPRWEPDAFHDGPGPSSLGRAGVVATLPAPGVLEIAPRRRFEATPPVPALGPWAGEVRRIVEGREVEAVITLDAAGDPVAEHHTFGGRRVSAIDPGLKGLPVLPFTVMAEMLAQVAARLVPGATLVGLRDLRARRWIRYEDVPIDLRVVARADPDRPGEVFATLANPSKGGESPDVEGVVVFSPGRPEPPAAADLGVEGPEASVFTARSIYDEQWLFHGPALQAVVGIGAISDSGIEGTLRVLPRRGLYRDPGARRPLLDPIVLDAYTHLLGAWGLDRLPEGDVIFPLRLGRLELFGDDPPEGADCPCRIRIKAIDRHRVTVDAEVLRTDGRVWMRLTGWDDWRFYWPSRYRDVFRQPDRTLVGEPLPLPGSTDARAVWVEPPADMGRPVWRDVLEQVQLSPIERAGCLKPTGHDGRRTLRLWGRIAAKEAARRLWLDEGRPAVFPADLAIEPDPNGRPVLRSLAEPSRSDMPSVSIAHTVGVAVGIATRDPHAWIGIDVERIVGRAASFESLAFLAGERSILDRLAADQPGRDEWTARLWSAKEAAAKATRLGLIAGPSSVEVVAADASGGMMRVALGPELASACPALAGRTLRVRTARRGDYAWSWTIAHDKEDCP